MNKFGEEIKLWYLKVGELKKLKTEASFTYMQVYSRAGYGPVLSGKGGWSAVDCGGGGGEGGRHVQRHVGQEE